MSELNIDTLKILLVDDDSNEREGVRFLIEENGFPLEILEAPNGQKALDIIRRQPIHILFTDVKMPYMDGLELSSIVHQEFPSIKIIVFSAYGEFEYAKKAMEAKAVNYLLKPVEEEEFYKVLQAAITSCREEAEMVKQRQKRMISDRKLQWIHIMTGKCAVDKELITSLCEQGYPVDGEMLLIHMETQMDFFAQHEPDLLQCLAAHTPGPYEYINVYPNSSYILLFTPVTREALCTFCRKLSVCTERNGEQSAFLICDTPFPLQQLSVQAKRVMEINQQTMMGETGPVFLSELNALKHGRISEIQESIDAVEKAIETRDKALIMKQISGLLGTMMEKHLFSAAYIHHIFCELFGRLYTQYGITDSQGLEKAVSRLGSCRSRQALLLLASTVLDEVKQNQTEQADASFTVQKVKWIIQKEYGSNLSLEYLAGCVGLAPSYLSFVFKQETGENLVKYMTDYRMEMARKLLNDSALKIVQVARMCGYDNQSYFNRLFKNTYGMTPKQYREKNNE